MNLFRLNSFEEIRREIGFRRNTGFTVFSQDSSLLKVRECLFCGCALNSGCSEYCCLDHRRLHGLRVKRVGGFE